MFLIIFFSLVETGVTHNRGRHRSCKLSLGAAVCMEGGARGGGQA